jgi:hypothetical protein
VANILSEIYESKSWRFNGRYGSDSRIRLPISASMTERLPSGFFERGPTRPFGTVEFLQFGVLAAVEAEN